MTSVYVLLDTIDDVKDFVQIVNRFPYEVDLGSGRYVVDGKSIMGIFSLDLKRPLEARIHSDDCDDLLKILKPLLYNNPEQN